MRARPFVLSHSSMERLERCKRAHYWAVYGAVHPVAELAQLAGLLRRGQGLPQIVGDQVHRTASALVSIRQHDRPLPDLDVVEGRTVAQFHNAVAEARRGGTEAPLLEEFYGVEDVPGRVEQARQDLVHVVQSLLLNRHLTSPAPADIMGAARFGTLEVGDDEAAVPVSVVGDYLYRASGDRRVVVEWKSGQVRGATEQVGLYVLALTQREALEPEQVVGVAVYLAHYQEAPLVGSAEIVEAARARIRKARRAAQELVLDGDLQANQPQHLEVFEQLPDGSKECRWCSFRRLCGRG